VYRKIPSNYRWGGKVILGIEILIPPTLGSGSESWGAVWEDALKYSGSNELNRVHIELISTELDHFFVIAPAGGQLACQRAATERDDRYYSPMKTKR